MQVRIEQVSPVERKLIVEVPWPTVQDRLSNAYRELSKQVQLKGFRKGKVPRSVLEQMFGRQVREEVAVQLVRESFVTAATEHNLEAVSEPMVQDDPKIVKGKPFAFEAIVEVKGEIETVDYGGIELTRRKVEVTDAEVDKALEQVQREHTELLPIEGRDRLAAGDIAAIRIAGTVGEHEVNRPQLTVDLGDREHEPLPGLGEKLIGLPLDAADQAIEIEIPEDHEDKEIAGRTASLTVSVIEARQKDVPAIDDDLAKDTGEAETLDQLKVALRKRLEDRVEQEIRSELRDQALKKLIEKNQIPIASSLIERAAQLKTARFQAMLGIPDGQDELLGDEIREKLREGADDDVRGQLLLDKVAKEESIEVSEDEVTERVDRMAKLQGQQPGRLRAEMERDGRLANLQFQLLQEKVLDFLVSRASVSEVDIDAEAQPAGAGAGETEAAAGEAEG